MTTINTNVQITTHIDDNMCRYPNGNHTARDRHPYPRFLLYSIGQYSQWLWNRLDLENDDHQNSWVRMKNINLPNK